MRRIRYMFLFTILFLSIMVITVSATSWGELKPQEVIDRADVIVTGKYDFTSKPKHSEFIFHGVDFNIKNVYKGDNSERITAGIDYNDVGWAEGFQKEGGEFLLFLEKSKDADFLIPVGGPNGMVRVYNGKVEEPNDERRAFFEDFLKSSPEITIDTDFETLNDNQNDSENDKSNLRLYVSATFLVGISVLFTLYRYNRKK